jgi:hypothetical protein
MGRKLTIPIVPTLTSRRVEEVKKRLGGRANSDAGAGEIVQVRREAAPDLLGVVIFASGGELDVMTDEQTVRRTDRSRVGKADEAADCPEWVKALAADARVFGSLEEGQHVRYVGEGGQLLEGTLVEKCRYGGIVLCPNQSLMGVGFRKLWPAKPEGAAS